MDPLRIIIADDHEIYRDGLKMVLKKEKWVDVVGEANNGRELVELAKKIKPDVIITDIVMPEMDGIAALKEIMKLDLKICAIALSMFNEETMIVEMLEAGALGYLLKNAEKEEITEAIRSVHRNQPYYCKTTSAKLVNLISKSRFNPYKNHTVLKFSQKELAMIKLICSEKTNKEMSEELFLSSRTIEGYRTRIMQKMAVKSTAGIVVYAIKTGIYKV